MTATKKIYINYIVKDMEDTLQSLLKEFKEAQVIKSYNVYSIITDIFFIRIYRTGSILSQRGISCHIACLDESVSDRELENCVYYTAKMDRIVYINDRVGE